MHWRTYIAVHIKNAMIGSMVELVAAFGTKIGNGLDVHFHSREEGCVIKKGNTGYEEKCNVKADCGSEAAHIYFTSSDDCFEVVPFPSAVVTVCLLEFRNKDSAGVSQNERWNRQWHVRKSSQEDAFTKTASGHGAYPYGRKSEGLERAG